MAAAQPGAPGSEAMARGDIFDGFEGFSVKFVEEWLVFAWR
jgi:hypothetical protein